MRGSDLGIMTQGDGRHLTDGAIQAPRDLCCPYIFLAVRNIRGASESISASFSAHVRIWRDCLGMIKVPTYSHTE